MRGTEGIVDVRVELIDQFRHQRRIVGLFTRVEAEVLHHAHPRDELCDPIRHHVQGILRIHLALGSTHVRGAHDLGALGNEPLEGRDRRADPQVVSDDPALGRVFDRDVEVGPHEDPLAFKRAEVLKQRQTPKGRRPFGHQPRPTRATRSTRRFE